VRMEGGPKKVDADLHGGVHHHVGASPVKAAEVVAADADDGDVEIYDLLVVTIVSLLSTLPWRRFFG
jgi:hypothetical protein